MSALILRALERNPPPLINLAADFTGRPRIIQQDRGLFPTVKAWLERKGIDGC
jgi:hypothetical protein